MRYWWAQWVRRNTQWPHRGRGLGPAVAAGGHTQPLLKKEKEHFPIIIYQQFVMLTSTYIIIIKMNAVITTIQRKTFCVNEE